MSGIGPALALAPMEGVTDFPLRLWLWMCSGIPMMSTPFLRVTPSYQAPQSRLEKFAPEIFVLRGELPYNLTPQIMTAGSADFIRIAKLFLKASRYVNSVELNCGCPSPNCAEGGAGSELLAIPSRFSQICREISQEMTPKTLAVKMRTGTDHSDLFPALLDGVSMLPLARLTIHGRTRAQKYQNYADWWQIEKAAKTLGFPVWGSGDICDLKTFKERVETAASIEGVLLGRGQLRNPWLYQEIIEAKGQIISANCLTLALQSLVLLFHLFNSSPHRLFKLVSSGAFQIPAHTSAEAWTELFAKLIETEGRAPDFTFHSVDRVTLGRTKLIWNYFRSSLPVSFFDSAILRAKTAPDMFDEIRRASGKVRHENLILSYSSSLDWIYSGAKKSS